MTTITISLPDSLAKEAERAGLLTDTALESVLRDEIRRRATDDLFAAMDKMANVGDQPMTIEEIQAEIDAVRQARRDRRS